MVYALARRAPCELSTIDEAKPPSLRAAMIAARSPVSELRMRAVEEEEPAPETKKTPTSNGGG